MLPIIWLCSKHLLSLQLLTLATASKAGDPICVARGCVFFSFPAIALNTCFRHWCGSLMLNHLMRTDCGLFLMDNRRICCKQCRGRWHGRNCPVTDLSDHQMHLVHQRRCFALGMALACRVQLHQIASSNCFKRSMTTVFACVNSLFLSSSYLISSSDLSSSSLEIEVAGVGRLIWGVSLPPPNNLLDLGFGLNSPSRWHFPSWRPLLSLPMQ